MKEAGARFMILRLSNKKQTTFSSELISSRREKCLFGAFPVPFRCLSPRCEARAVPFQCFYGASVALLQNLTIFLKFRVVEEVFFHILGRSFPLILVYTQNAVRWTDNLLKYIKIFAHKEKCVKKIFYT